MTNYKTKYIKYKNKYLKLKGGAKYYPPEPRYYTNMRTLLNNINTYIIKGDIKSFSEVIENECNDRNKNHIKEYETIYNKYITRKEEFDILKQQYYHLLDKRNKLMDYTSPSTTPQSSSRRSFSQSPSTTPQSFYRNYASQAPKYDQDMQELFDTIKNTHIINKDIELFSNKDIELFSIDIENECNNRYDYYRTQIKDFYNKYNVLKTEIKNLEEEYDNLEEEYNNLLEEKNKLMYRHSSSPSRRTASSPSRRSASSPSRRTASSPSRSASSPSRTASSPSRSASYPSRRTASSPSRSASPFSSRRYPPSPEEPKYLLPLSERKALQFKYSPEEPKYSMPLSERKALQFKYSPEEPKYSEVYHQRKHTRPPILPRPLPHTPAPYKTGKCIT